MSDARTGQSLRNLTLALDRLGKALAEPDQNLLVIDGTIQRFEFVIELFWKTIKRMLESEGVQTGTPREAIQAAFQAQWIHDETAWLEMLRDRNLTSHTYDEETARRVHASIKANYPELRRAHADLVARFEARSAE